MKEITIIKYTMQFFITAVVVIVLAAACTLLFQTTNIITMTVPKAIAQETSEIISNCIITTIQIT
jgi:hypothetical protein